jgi:hypothetical protein
MLAAVLALRGLQMPGFVQHHDAERLEFHLARLGERALDDAVGLLQA